ncbi:hypothetical protein NFI96_016457 [Prochilodus magdalenae]|nr:hypothetical protein NFI96_016457 [Prochilodus magdalenae]
MDSVVAEDQTLPFDINGSCSISRLPDSLNSGDFTMDNMTAPMFPGQKMSPAKAMTMKDYENQITALKKENFNLKLRIYFLEERVQQKCDDSTEDIYKTNIELKVEVESMKRDLAEKQELLVSASKALESLASRDSGEGIRERTQREMDALREAFGAKMRELEESLRCAEEEIEKMASIAEQEKLRNLGLEKELEAARHSGPSHDPGSTQDPGSTPGQTQELQQALQEKDRMIERLQDSIKKQDALIREQQQKCPDQPAVEPMVQEKELQALKEELDRERGKAEKEKQCDVAIGNLQDAHAAEIQKLHNERDRLNMLIAHKYQQNNPQEPTCPGQQNLQERSPFKKGETRPAQISQQQKHQQTQLKRQRNKTRALVEWPQKEKEPKQQQLLHSRRLSTGVHHGTRRGSPGTGQLRRCVSLEPLSRVSAECSASSFGSGFASRKSQEVSKAGRVLGTGVRARSREYSDLVYRKATLTSRSVSLQSLKPEHPDYVQVTTPACRQTHPRQGSSSAALETTSLLSDFLQLLRSTRARPLPLTLGSRIPVLSQPSDVFGLAQVGRARRAKAEKALRELEKEFNDEYLPLKQEVGVAKESEVNRLQQMTRQLTEELNSTKSSNQMLKHSLEEMEREIKTLSTQLEERDNELAAEKRNSLKRDKTIQGLSILLKEKEKEVWSITVEELYGNLEEKDQALAKAREALHKAQLQKYQASRTSGAEEQQALLLSQQAELSRLQAEAHSSLLEAQRLQRLLSSRDAELALLRQDKQQLEQELEQLQQQKRKADKTINDLQNQLKKLTGELADRENSLEHQQLEQQQHTRAAEHKLQTTIQHLTTSLTQKDQQLQDYINMVQDLEQDRALGGSDAMLVKLRERLREKEKALEKALDEKFSAVEEKENEIHLLQLNVREKERDLERLNHLLAHNEETINSFDALLKEKDVELQQLLNSLKNVQRSKQESEENLQRALREKDSIIQHLQHTLELKSKDMEEMVSTVLSQSESQGRDLVEQMNQRIKVTELMLTEAVKDRERLVCENQTAVENLLATINSKDQLLKESAERHAQALSDRAAELQNLRSQLADFQLQLSNSQKLGSMATQDASVETARLCAALAEKDAVIKKLLEHGQERDRYMTEVKVGETSPPQVLELRQTIQVLQERLEDREAELSRRNNEENMEKSLTGSKKSGVLLKKELDQKTDALNSALKRENQLKMSLAEVQLMVSELEGQLEAQTANIGSLTSTLNTKEEIIAELQQRLVQRGESRPTAAQDLHLQPGDERSFPSLPQRERTLIGGDSQQEVMPSVVQLRLEQVELNRVLRAEQQLYSNLVRAVKEQDSAQRLQALQLELAALTLLRQQLEDGIRCNEELREQLHKEIQRANQREGADPAELESMRDALEEAQRWNASLQARLGQIQSRGGGVGQANDSADTLSLIGEQTSYMSICVGEGLEEELSVEQLRLKVSELQALNAELQRKLATAEGGTVGKAEGESDLIDLSSPSKQPQGLGRPLATNAEKKQTGPDIKEKIDESPEAECKIVTSPVAQPKGRGYSSNAPEQHGGEQTEIASLLRDCGAGSVSQLREEVAKLRLEASELRGLLKEENSAEYKESAESSGESDGHTDLHQTVKTLRSEARSHRKVIRLLKEQLQRNTEAVADGGPGFDPELIVSMAREMERLRVENEASQKHALSLEDMLKEKGKDRNKGGKQEDDQERKEEQRQGQNKLTKGQKHHMARHAAYVKSRLPVPVRPAKQTDRRESTGYDAWGSTECYSGTDSDQSNFCSRGLKRAELESSPNSSSEALWSSETKRNTYPETKQNSDVKRNTDKMSEVQESELLSQLELLNQECQEKEELISRLQLQMQDWEGLEAELQEKDKLNSQYQEALQAAESTIAYLTACNLDNESGLGHSGSGSNLSLQQQCEELQRAIQEKDQLNAQLLECLNTAESAIASLTTADRPESPSGLSSSQGDPQELCERLEGLLHKIKALQEHKRVSTGAAERLPGFDEGSAVESDLQRQAESLQESLLRQCRLNAELQEKLRSAEEAITKLSTDASTPKQSSIAKSLEEEEMLKEGQDRLIACLSGCILAAEQAVESVTDFCNRYSHPSEIPQVLPGKELEQNLDRLCRAFLERDRFGDSGTADILPSTIAGPPENKEIHHTLQVLETGHQKTSTPISQQNQESLTSLWKRNLTETWSTGQAETTLHKNLLVLIHLFKEHAQKVQQLEQQLDDEQRCALGEQGDGKTQDAPENLLKILNKKQKKYENLKEELTEKHKMCQNLQQELTEKHKMCQNLEQELTEKHEMCQNLEQELTEKHERCKKLEEELTEKHERCQNLEEELTEKHERCQNLEEELSEKHKLCQNLEEELTENHKLCQNLKEELTEEHRRGQNLKEELKEEHRRGQNLEEELQEKYKVCQNLEKELATAQSIIALQNSTERVDHIDRRKVPPGSQDDKGVQVDAQDLGYETSGRSETEVEREEGSSTDVDGVVCSGPALSPILKRALAGFSSAENLDSAASSPSYPSSPDLSSPRPCDSSATSADPNLDPALLCQQLQQLRSKIESQHKVIQHLQRLLRKKSLSAEALSSTSDSVDRQADEDMQALKARIAQLTAEVEKERTVNRSSQLASPSKIESLVQSQARELCELREQIRVSRGLGVEQRKQLQDLRGALEELLLPSDGQLALDTTLKQQLDRSLSLLEKLEQGDTSVGNEERVGLELAQSGECDWLVEELQCLRSRVEGDREQQQLQIVYLCQQNQNLALATQQHMDLLSAELQEKDKHIQQLNDLLHGQAARIHQDSDSEISDRISNDGSAAFPDSPSILHTHTFSRASTGTKVSNGVVVSETATFSFPGSVSGGVGLPDGGVRILQRENERLQQQLRNSEELNATLRSELDLTRSVLTNTHDQGSPSAADTHAQSQTTVRQQDQQPQILQESGSKSISSDLLAEHLQEVRALRQRLEETIRTNERLREQLEKKLREAEKDPGTNIFIAGSEEPAQLTSELHFLLAQNRTIKEQLNQGARDKQKENDRLRETLARRSAKLELSRRECEMLRQERTHLQDNLYRRLQCESKLQKQQLADTQQLLQSVQVELQVHEQIKNSAHTYTGDGHSGSDCGKVDLSELLSEVRRLRLQLERSIQTNTALRHKLEQKLLSRSDGPSTININYLLHQTDEGGKSEMFHTDACNASHDSGSSVRSGSPAPSRLVPGHRLWADRHGRHVVGLIEDYNALRKQISEANRLNAVMDTQLQESNRTAEYKALSGSVNTMQQMLEEAGRLLKLLWRVSLPSGDLTHMQQDEVLRSEISRLKSRLSQQERMLTGAVKRLRSTNQLKEGMERIIIDQLSLTHGVLRKARGNLEEIPLNSH